jgi:hypothetical protein
MKQKENNLFDLIEAIEDNIEWLETLEEDEIECISIENLEGILSKFFNKTIKINKDGKQN